MNRTWNHPLVSCPRSYRGNGARFSHPSPSTNFTRAYFKTAVSSIEPHSRPSFTLSLSLTQRRPDYTMAFSFDLLAVASINARTPRWRKTAVHLPVEQDSVTSVYIYVRFSRREALKISIYSLHAVYYSYRRVNWLSFFGKREKGCGLDGRMSSNRRPRKKWKERRNA